MPVRHLLSRKSRTFVAKMQEAVSYKAQIAHILEDEKQFLDPLFTATRLAARLGVPNYTLSRILHHTYGMNYTRIVHHLRVQEAMRLLKDRRYDPYSIDDIGMMSGFHNRQSFFAAFKRSTGFTPDKLRTAAKDECALQTKEHTHSSTHHAT